MATSRSRSLGSRTSSSCSPGRAGRSSCSRITNWWFRRCTNLPAGSTGNTKRLGWLCSYSATHLPINNRPTRSYPYSRWSPASSIYWVPCAECWSTSNVTRAISIPQLTAKRWSIFSFTPWSSVSNFTSSWSRTECAIYFWRLTWFSRS